MDLYSIPGDTGGTWRYNKLLELISSDVSSSMPVARTFLKRNKATKSEVVWWSFLYSTCYCIGTASLLYTLLDYRTVTKKELEAFWETNKSRLIFQTDRKYVKIMNQFVDIVYGFIQRSNRKPWGYMKQFIKEDSLSTYQSFYKEIGSWRYYGRFSIILLIDTLNSLLKIPMDSPEYDWKSGSTTTSAIFHVLYEDDRANTFEDSGKITSQEVQAFNVLLGKLKEDLRKIDPDSSWTTAAISPELCEFRKLFKKTRYLGYYIDRKQEELNWLEQRWPEVEGVFQVLWEARKLNMPEEFLGEIGGWSGVQKDRMLSWVTKGEFR
jgi:hypothetical protein